MLALLKLFEYFNEKYPDFKGKFYPGVSYRHLFVYNDKENAEKLATHDVEEKIYEEIKKIVK